MHIALQVAQIVAPVFFLALIGYFWVRAGWDYDIGFVTRLTMMLAIPCLVFMSLQRMGVNQEQLLITLLAAVVSYVLVAVCAAVFVRVSGYDMRAFWAPVTFGNTGNIGLPLALFAFGQSGFDTAVIVFAVMIIFNFSFGVWVVSGGGSVKAALREPLFWSVILGALFLVMGWSLPVWLASTLDLTGQMGIPLMLVTLGVAISGLRVGSVAQAAWISLVKLLICIPVSYLAGRWLGLSHEALAVLVMQMATPVAVSSYMLAAKFRTRPEEIAGLVVVSTLMSLIAIPLIMAYFI